MNNPEVPILGARPNVPVPIMDIKADYMTQEMAQKVTDEIGEIMRRHRIFYLQAVWRPVFP